MQTKSKATRDAIAIAVGVAATILPGCGSHEVTMPRVTEESLSPEQKAQFEKMQNAQAEAFRKAGMNQAAVMTPQEYAQQQFESVKKEQEAAKEGTGQNTQAAADSPAAQ